MPKQKNKAAKVSTKSKKEVRLNKDGKPMKQRKAMFSKKTAPASKGVKKEKRIKKDGTEFKDRRNKPGTVALREIKRYQKHTQHFFPRAAFARVVKEIAGGINNEVRFQSTALNAM